MDLIERATVMHYHRHRIAEFGPRAQALGWKAEHSQWSRFEVILRSADFSHCSVLDVGCGRGDLKAHLDDAFPGVRYTGIDLLPEFVEDAETLDKLKAIGVNYAQGYGLSPPAPLSDLAG